MHHFQNIGKAPISKPIISSCLKQTVFVWFLFLGIGSSSVYANSTFEDGLAAANNGDFATALTIWVESASSGDLRSQTNLGLIYLNGDGVPQDYEMALAWLLKSAEHGDAKAQTAIAEVFHLGLDGRWDVEGAIYWYKKAAAQGYDRAVNALRALGINEPSGESSGIPTNDLRISKGLEPLVIDNEPPNLKIIEALTHGASGHVHGLLSDNKGIAALFVNGVETSFGNDGIFLLKVYVPQGGTELTIEVFDQAGLSQVRSIFLERSKTQTSTKNFVEPLNPLVDPSTEYNDDSLAMIIGVSEYEKTSAARFADRDAEVFYDYARLKLGIPKERIQTLVNDKADVVGLLSGINKWLKRSVKQGKSDVYIFFAGHGLASADGDKTYLIPYDGVPDFLERTAISRDEVFSEIASVNPRSVTVFLDTCYSGDTRGGSKLVAARSLRIKVLEESVPANFTVLTAAGGDQIAKPLEEARHGLFSYYLMKGMEGDADTNKDNAITAKELHAFVKQNVIQQSGGSQVPELQGDAERVLVRFQ